MSCLGRKPVDIPMDTVKIIRSEKFPHDCPSPPAQPRHGPQPRMAWGSEGGEGEVIVNQACGDVTLDVRRHNMPSRPLTSPPPAPPLAPSRREPGHRKASAAELCYRSQFHCKVEDVIVNQYVRHPASPSCHQPAPCEPLDCPTCGHTYNFTGKRPRVLSCLHSVCEECLQILYESCPKYKFITCPTCRRETVLFTDYGLAALAVNTTLLSRLPAEGGPGGTVQWGGEADHSCYQTVRQYCQSACTCQLENPLSSCAIM